MTALTVIIFILQLVLTAWAIGITIVVVDLFKAFRSFATVDGEAFASLFDAQNTTLHALHAVLKTVGAVDEEAKGYKAMVDAELEKQKDNNRFALETIQEARRIYNSINKSEQEDKDNE
jgi:hypothetical protein